MSVKERFEAAAAKWVASGRSKAKLQTHDWALLQLVCWNHSPGAKKEGVSDTLADYIAASRALKPDGWYDFMLSAKDSCTRCGETYRVENLQFCTDCEGTYCYQCVGAYPKGENGNPQHGCGGEIVG